MKEIFMIFFIIIVFLLLAMFMKNNSNNLESYRYDVLKDAKLLAIEQEFRDNPSYDMDCTKTCTSPTLQKRDKYLEENCLYLRGVWTFTDDNNNFSVKTSRQYYKKENCSK